MSHQQPLVVCVAPLRAGFSCDTVPRKATLGGFARCGAAIALALGLALSLGAFAWAAPGVKEPGTGPKLSPLELDDVPEKFVPKKPRSEAEEDRIRAFALFASGRMAEQEQDLAKALRFYQRAYRFDSDAAPVLREIVILAFNLDRQSEALRYAMLNDGALTPPGGKANAEQVVLWMEMGRLSFLDKKYDDAAKYFAKVVKAVENPGESNLKPGQVKAIMGTAEITWQLFGESFLEADRLDEAQHCYEKSNDTKKDEALLAYNLARIETAKKQPAAALAKLDVYLDKHDDSQGTAPYQLLALLLKELNKSDELIPRLEKLRAGHEENMPLSYFLAQQYREAKKYDQAEPIYKKLIEEHKRRPPVEAYQGLLAVYRETKQPDKVLQTLGEAVSRAGSLSVLGDEGGDITADKELTNALIDSVAKQQAEQGEKLDKGVRLAGGLLALENKQYDVARQLLEPAIAAEKGRSAELLMSWGLELFMANQYEEAAKIFRRGIDENVLPDNNPAFQYYLAGALAMDDKTDEAIAMAKVAAEKKSDNPRFASRVAWILYHAKRNKEAEEAYEALIKKYDAEQDSSDMRDVVKEARLALSNLCVLDNRMPQAEEWLEQVLDEFPGDVGALNDLGYLWADQNKHLERALRMTQKAVEEEPKNMAYRDSLGWAYYRLGRYGEAIAELKIAADVEEPDGVILDHYGDALFKHGDVKEAVKSWTRAVEKMEKEKDEPAKIKTIRDKIAKAEEKSK